MTEPQYTPVRLCSAPNCSKPARDKQRFCHMHAKRIAVHGTLELAPRITANDRFWAKVDKSGVCWLWAGAINKESGYGRFRFDGQMRVASQVAWILTHGAIPPGQDVCHNCPAGDNPTCVNPAHLFLGTRTDNMQDCVSKGRLRYGVPDVRGEQNGQAKLTPDQVRDIRARYSHGGVTQQALADEFSVSRRAIGSIVSGRNWRHLLEDDGAGR